MTDPTEQIRIEDSELFNDTFNGLHEDIDKNISDNFDDFFADFCKNNGINDITNTDINLGNEKSSTSSNVQPRPCATATKKRLSLAPVFTEPPIKKIKTNIQTQPTDEIPEYLSNITKVFDRIMFPELQKRGHMINMEDLRQVALVKHKLALIDLDISLWTTYLYSGTNNFKPVKLQAAILATSTILAVPYLSIWPEEVEASMIAKGYTHLNSNEVDHLLCFNYVFDALEEFKNQTNHYQGQLKDRKQCLGNTLTLELEEVIDTFVEQYGIALQRISVEKKIAIIQHKYNDRLIELEFHQESPFDYQIETFNNLTQYQLNKETTKLHLAILKQHLLYKQLPKIFDTFQIPSLITINTISNESTRQRLTHIYEKIIRRTKLDILGVYIAATEAELEECRKKFNTAMIQFKQNQRSDIADRKLTSTMCDFMQRRFRNNNAHLVNLYKLKSQFFVKASAVKNKI